MRSAPGTRSRTARKICSYSPGSAKPTVSGRLMVVAPSTIAASTTRHRYSRSVRLASSAENSTSSGKRRARGIELTRHLHLFLGGHGVAGRLLPVAQRGVEDDDVSDHELSLWT